MVNREFLKQEIDKLPETALEEIHKFILYQQFVLDIFENDTDYLNSIPNMVEKIVSGLKEPLSECVSEREVIW